MGEGGADGWVGIWESLGGWVFEDPPPLWGWLILKGLNFLNFLPYFTFGG